LRLNIFIIIRGGKGKEMTRGMEENGEDLR